MNKIADVMKKQSHFRCGDSVSDEEISSAEQKLGFSFAPEYRDYIAELGFASFSGHELTGICKYKRLNVVEVTTAEWSNNQNTPKTMYVIERLNIDNIIVWQDSSGAIYETNYDSQPILICSSLEEYILK